MSACGDPEDLSVMLCPVNVVGSLVGLKIKMDSQDPGCFLSFPCG